MRKTEVSISIEGEILRLYAITAKTRVAFKGLTFLGLALTLILPQLSFAQDDQAAPNSTTPLLFPAPTTKGIIGQKDAGALAEVTAHLQAVSATGWRDLEGTGTLTFPAGDTHSASLYLLRSTHSRLDIVMDSGTRSLRLRNSVGSFQDERNNQGALLPGTNRAGIVAFPRVWFDAATSPRISLYDQGPYTARGQTLHRITLEYPLFSSTSSSGGPTVATDLYFDSNTHLLLYSVDALSFSSSPNQAFSRITSYGGYQAFNGVLIPSTIGQSLNGQLEWTLQLSQVTTNTNPPVSTFSF